MKYKNNFIWQIYYSDYNDRYFMLVPSKEMNNPELFYILKKQIECKKNNVKEKIFVPISHLDYSGRYLKKSEISDVENYLWYFTKQWPDVFEVYDNKEKLYVQIIGQIDVYEKVLSTYRIVLKDKEAAVNFYKLLKALFILSTGAEEQYKFNLKINKEAGIDFFFEQEKIEYIKLPNFINNQVNKKIKDIENVKLEIVERTAKLQKLKKINESKIEEYLEKQKQISTFLECKKTFLGRVRYYFKSKNIKKEINNNEENIKEDKKQEPEIFNVSIPEIINGERKSEIMEKEAKKVAEAMSDYATAEKAVLLKRVKVISIIGLVALIIGLIMESICYDSMIPIYESIKGICLGLGVGALVTMVLYTTGILEKIKNKKSKQIKIVAGIGCAIMIICILVSLIVSII